MNVWNRLRQVAAPDADVVTLAQAKAHLRITWDTEDGYITQVVAASRSVIEGPHGAGFCLTPQTWRLSLDTFPGPLLASGRASRNVGYRGWNFYGEIQIPLGPVTAVNSVTYKDADGNDQTVADYRLDLDSEPCRIWPARDQAWPAVVYEPGAVKVEFVAGYSTPPPDLGWAMLLLISHFYEHREAVVGVLERSITPTELPFGVTAILDRYRVGMIA